MTIWAVRIPTARYEAERLLHHDTLDLTTGDEHLLPVGLRPVAGEEVLVVLDGQPPLIVALGRITAAGVREDIDPDDPESELECAPLVVAYTRRLFDDPVPAGRLTVPGAIFPVDPDVHRELTGRISPPPHRSRWLVSLDLPIEASSAAEAVRLFWSYVTELGPRELPAFVWPAGDELAMRAFVLGEPANQDPEED